MKTPARSNPPQVPSDGNRPPGDDASTAESKASAPGEGLEETTSDTAMPHGALRQLDPLTHIFSGNPGDHPLVLDFLSQSQRLNLQEDFQSRLDNPHYKASDRLLVRRNEELVGHAQLSHDTAWFAGQRIPTATLHDLATLPEYAPANYDRSLLSCAEEMASQEGAVLGLVHTTKQAWYGQAGWSLLHGQGHTRANTRAVLAHLEAQESAPCGTQRKKIEVVTWRHFELEAIRSIYDELAPEMWGTMQRSEAWWQWLVGRKTHDQVLLARIPQRQAEESFEAMQDDRFTLRQSQDVVGYAVVRDSCLVEVFTRPGYEIARSMLLKRACQDAIDRDHHFVALHTAGDDPLHDLLVTAGGTWIDDAETNAGCWLAKLFSPERWVEKLYPLLHERARSRGISRPVEIDFSDSTPASDPAQRFVLTRRSARLVPSETAQSPYVLDDLLELLLSNFAWPTADTTAATVQPTAKTLRSLFPRQLFWQSPFESIKL